MTADFFNNLQYYQKFVDMDSAGSYIVYGGDQEQKRSYAQVIPWNKLSTLEQITG